MKRVLLSAFLGALVVATVAGAVSTLATVSASGKYCSKLCMVGYRCVPTTSGGACVPGHGLMDATSLDRIDEAASGKYCNKLCMVGYHCVPTTSGGTCVPGHGLTDAASIDPIDGCDIE